MFEVFKKQEEEQAIPEEKAQEDPLEENVQEESAQYKAFAAGFLPRELTILAVTGAGVFSADEKGENELWTATMELTAWMEEDSPDVHRGTFALIALGDDRLLDVLRYRARPDFIIRFRGRVSEDGQRLLLLNLPERGFDPDLIVILAEQKRPDTFEEPGLGTFVLNRQVNWFETEAEWLEDKISLVFDQEEDRVDCLLNAKMLLGSARGWDRWIRALAADKLLALANESAEDGEITREQFMERMEPESIELRAEGGFEFWFGDGDMFQGRSIHVSGDLRHGVDDAEIEG